MSVVRCNQFSCHLNLASSRHIPRLKRVIWPLQYRSSTRHLPAIGLVTVSKCTLVGEGTATYNLFPRKGLFYPWENGRYRFSMEAERRARYTLVFGTQRLTSADLPGSVLGRALIANFSEIDLGQA